MRPLLDPVQSQLVRGRSLSQSIRGLARSGFAFRDCKCRMFPGLFRRTTILDSTRKLAAHDLMLQRDGPALPKADRWRYRKPSPVTRDRPPFHKSRHKVQLAASPFPLSIPWEDWAPPRSPNDDHRNEAAKSKQACQDGNLR